MERTFVIKSDGEALAQGALEFIQERLARTEGAFWIALSGGSTPKVLYRKMAQAALPWERIFLIWGDERFVAHDHPDSNYLMVKEALLDSGHVAADHVYAWPILQDAQASADAFESTLRHVAPQGVQLALLGMGEDGHTASLFPDTAALEEKERFAVANWVAKLDCWRLTLSYPYFALCDEVLFLIGGAGKNQPLGEVLERDAHPSGKLRARKQVYIYADEAAAKGLSLKS